MREGFYSIFYTGVAGSGVLMLCLVGGRLVGLDAAGGSLIGTYAVENDHVAASVTFKFRAGDLVTGQVLAQGFEHKSDFRIPTQMLDGTTALVDIGTGPINARGEYISAPL